MCRKIVGTFNASKRRNCNFSRKHLSPEKNRTSGMDCFGTLSSLSLSIKPWQVKNVKLIKQMPHPWRGIVRRRELEGCAVSPHKSYLGNVGPGNMIWSWKRFGIAIDDLGTRQKHIVNWIDRETDRKDSKSSDKWRPDEGSKFLPTKSGPYCWTTISTVVRQSLQKTRKKQAKGSACTGDPAEHLALQKLDDGWPESVEEQSLLLLVWRH